MMTPNLLDRRALNKPHKAKGSAGGPPHSRVGIAERRRLADTSNQMRGALVRAREKLGV